MYVCPLGNTNRKCNVLSKGFFFHDQHLGVYYPLVEEFFLHDQTEQNLFCRWKALLSSVSTLNSSCQSLSTAAYLEPLPKKNFDRCELTIVADISKTLMAWRQQPTIILKVYPFLIKLVKHNTFCRCSFQRAMQTSRRRLNFC